MGMETKDEFMTFEPEQAQVGSRGPTLVINEMVIRNVKSYAGEQRVGPFHKIRMETRSGVKDFIPAWIKFSVQAAGEIPYSGIYYDPPEEESSRLLDLGL
ncbi:hypothetical protein ES332_D11G337800v1 [Gossypium tomentosum]|uniref:Uncharacterized protein n=1 Tax=Gossypium tomentosum TaxID=34277 RepID=A0A5D2IUY2_GOSTO|nr:hypothetical protein ES332_D11G337800v1 [Gossypium tomentosum]